MYSVFPSSCNIRLQEQEPCHPIKLQVLNSAPELAHKVDTEKVCHWEGGSDA